MAQFNYEKLALRVDKILRRFGRAPNTTYLRRRNGSDVTDYVVTALEADYMARDRSGDPIRRDSTEYILSVVDLSISPNEETDLLVLINSNSTETEMEIMAPPKRTAPGGVNIFWQINCKER